MKIICGIYKFTNKVNHKIYIGKSVNVYGRYESHKKTALSGKKTLFYNALRKYGIDNFDFEIIKECSREELNEYEKFYIKLYDSNNPQYGYNMTPGGDGGAMTYGPWNKGKKMTSDFKKRVSESVKKRMKDPVLKEKMSKSLKEAFSKPETKKKMSKAKKGKKPWNKGKHYTGIKKKSKESIEKTRLKNIGQKRTEEQKKRISDSHKGKITSEETKQKQRNAHKGKKYNKMKDEGKQNISKAQRYRFAEGLTDEQKEIYVSIESAEERRLYKQKCINMI